MGREITRGALQEAQRQQARAFVLSSSEKNITADLQRKNLAGAILCSTLYNENQISSPLPTPVINLAGSRGPIELTGNYLSNEAAVGRMAAQYFLAHGYQNFLAISLKGLVTHDLRMQAFCEKIQSAGFQADSFSHNFKSTAHARSFLEHNQFMQEILQSTLEGIPLGTAIFCTNDDLAVVTLNVLKNAVPEHFDTCGVLGVDNDAGYYRYMGPIPGISSVQPAFQQMGAEAMAWLLTHTGPDAPEKVQTLHKLFPPVCIMERASTATWGCTDPLTARIIRWTWERMHLTGGVTVTQMAQAHHINRKTLERRFSLYAHTSPGDLIVRMRMDLASGLLRDTALSISEISHRCGFAKQDVLSRAIRRQYNCTPKDFRQAYASGSDLEPSAYFIETKWVPPANKASNPPATANIRQS